MQTGKTTDRNVAGTADLYISRIKKYNSFEVVTIPDLKNVAGLPVQEQKNREGKKQLQGSSRDDFIVLLDERGEEFRTAAFAGWLGKTFMLPKKRLLFIIGGPWGFSEEVYNRADFRISLSRMTFPHQLVRLLFLEQLYRAFTVIKGEPYHHE